MKELGVLMLKMAGLFSIIALGMIPASLLYLRHPTPLTTVIVIISVTLTTIIGPAYCIALDPECK
jgi:hypothetical protein